MKDVLWAYLAAILFIFGLVFGGAWLDAQPLLTEPVCDCTRDRP